MNWKAGVVKIICIVPAKEAYLNIFGLGSDNKMYRWDYFAGAWEKYWDESQ